MNEKFPGGSRRLGGRPLCSVFGWSSALEIGFSEKRIHTEGTVSLVGSWYPPQNPRGDLSSWVMDLKPLIFTRMRSRVSRTEEGSVFALKV